MIGEITANTNNTPTKTKDKNPIIFVFDRANICCAKLTLK